jgi:hypothetical protein
MPLTDPFDNTPPDLAHLPAKSFAATYEARAYVETNQALPVIGAPVTIAGTELLDGHYYLLAGQAVPGQNGIYQAVGEGEYHQKSHAGLGGLPLLRVKMIAGPKTGNYYAVDQSTGAIVLITAQPDTTDASHRRGRPSHPWPGHSPQPDLRQHPARRAHMNAANHEKGKRGKGERERNPLFPLSPFPPFHRSPNP